MQAPGHLSNFFISIVVLAVCSCASPKVLFDSEKIDGLTIVAPPGPYTQNPFDSVTSVGAGWVAFVPYAFQRKGDPLVRYEQNRHQWWGETPEGIRESILKAKSQGLKIMLKPQIYIPGGFTGDMIFQSEKDWLIWEKSFLEYTLIQARIAEMDAVDIFCIGTEMQKAIEFRPVFWEGLIDTIRTVYSGSLTYAANWDEFQQTPFWNHLDFIGINAYFPLSDKALPDPAELMLAWQKILPSIERVSMKMKKTILFTEYGYLSVSGTAGKQWELQSRLDKLQVNEEAQLIALEALFATFYQQNWWKGGFLWKWFPEMKGHEGYPEKDYTPQGKMAMKTLKTWFGQ